MFDVAEKSVHCFALLVLSVVRLAISRRTRRTRGTIEAAPFASPRSMFLHPAVPASLRLWDDLSEEDDPHETLCNSCGVWLGRDAFAASLRANARRRHRYARALRPGRHSALDRCRRSGEACQKPRHASHRVEEPLRADCIAGLHRVRKEVPGIEVFGGISLDLTVGGVNPAAVEWMTKVKGGYGWVVWLPTFDSENQVRMSKDNRSFASVVQDGAVTPAVSQVIALAAKHNLILETGHSSPTEALIIIREAKRQGKRDVQRYADSVNSVYWKRGTLNSSSGSPQPELTGSPCGRCLPLAHPG